MAIKTNHPVGAGHPWGASRKGFDILIIDADSQEELNSAVLAAERKFWQPWLIGTNEKTGLPGGVFYKPTGASSAW